MSCYMLPKIGKEKMRYSRKTQTGPAHHRMSFTWDEATCREKVHFGQVFGGPVNSLNREEKHNQPEGRANR